tara:strand:- start:2760 stop:3134 length:375 start_codon:yes stop_codon:yes gene_type:complete
MLRVVVAGLFFVGFYACAHGQYPQSIDKYVVDPQFEFEFTLINGFRKRTCFEIYVNGKMDGTLSRCLSSGESKKLSIWLSSKPDTETYNEVCSVGLTNKGFNTKMCSRVTTYFPAKELEGLDEF